MSLNPNKELKKYYSIHEVAEMFGIAESNLRFWETKFPTLKPRKSSTGNRMYTAVDIDEIRLIYNLVKERGMKLNTARQVIYKSRGEASNTADVLAHLQSIRDELESIRKELGDIV